MIGGFFMRYKLITTLIATSAFVLGACSKNSIAGKYGFQMGKEKGTHFGLFLELTDNYVTLESEPEVTNKYKACTFSFTVKEGEDSSQSISNLLTLAQGFLGQDGEILTLPAYYYLGNKIKNSDQTELKLGVDFNEIQKAIDDTDTSIVFPVLDPDTIEMIIYTTYGGGVITMNIPVAEEDAIFQLYWYGFDIYMDEEGIHINKDLVGHEPGTHPTADDVAEINKTYGDTHKELGDLIGVDLSSYRDYYTLAMGLIKQ